MFIKTIKSNENKPFYVKNYHKTNDDVQITVKMIT